MPRFDLPAGALAFGFINEPVGTHTSRTIMLSELTSLLEAAGPDASYADYQSAALELNAVHKGTASTRAKTFRHLRELYALSSDCPLFAGMRAVWHVEPNSRPIVAALCAAGRDPVFRATFETVSKLSPSEETTPGEMAEAVASAFPGHYGGTVAARLGRNIAASWKQAGFLEGRAKKFRCQPVVGPVAVAYGLYLAHLCEGRGELLFSSLWARMLDRPMPELKSLAGVAARQSWLEYREASGVIDVTFRHFEAVGRESETRDKHD